MTMLDDIRRDRDQGTVGDWLPWTIVNTWIMSGSLHVATIPKAHDDDWSPANARRIARVPQMEAALLAAEELAEIMANPVRSDDGLYDYYQAAMDAALANWRAAIEDTQ